MTPGEALVEIMITSTFIDDVDDDHALTMLSHADPMVVRWALYTLAGELGAVLNAIARQRPEDLQEGALTDLVAMASSHLHEFYDSEIPYIERALTK